MAAFSICLLLGILFLGDVIREINSESSEEDNSVEEINTTDMTSPTEMGYKLNNSSETLRSNLILHTTPLIIQENYTNGANNLNMTNITISGDNATEAISEVEVGNTSDETGSQSYTYNFTSTESTASTDIDYITNYTENNVIHNKSLSTDENLTTEMPPTDDSTLSGSNGSSESEQYNATLKSSSFQDENNITSYLDKSSSTILTIPYNDQNTTEKISNRTESVTEDSSETVSFENTTEAENESISTGDEKINQNMSYSATVSFVNDTSLVTNSSVEPLTEISNIENGIIIEAVDGSFSNVTLDAFSEQTTSYLTTVSSVNITTLVTNSSSVESTTEMSSIVNENMTEVVNSRISTANDFKSDVSSKQNTSYFPTASLVNDTSFVVNSSVEPITEISSTINGNITEAVYESISTSNENITTVPSMNITSSMKDSSSVESITEISSTVNENMTEAVNASTSTGRDFTSDVSSNQTISYLTTASSANGTSLVTNSSVEPTTEISSTVNGNVSIHDQNTTLDFSTKQNVSYLTTNDTSFLANSSVDSITEISRSVVTTNITRTSSDVTNLTESTTDSNSTEFNGTSFVTSPNITEFLPGSDKTTESEQYNVTISSTSKNMSSYLTTESSKSDTLFTTGSNISTEPTTQNSTEISFASNQTSRTEQYTVTTSTSSNNTLNFVTTESSENNTFMTSLNISTERATKISSAITTPDVITTDIVNLTRSTNEDEIVESRPTMQSLNTSVSQNISEKLLKDLTLLEVTNAVTIVFTAPNFKINTWITNYEQKFRKHLLACLVLYFHKARLNETTKEVFSSTTLEDLDEYPEESLNSRKIVYVAPFPILEEEKLYISFFVIDKLGNEPEEVVSAEILVRVLKMCAELLGKALGLNIVDVFEGVKTGQIDSAGSTAKQESIVERYATLFISISVIGGITLLIGIVAFGYLYCCNRSKAYNTDKKSLQGDMSASIEIGDMMPEQEILREEMSEKEVFGLANGSGNHIIKKEDEGWIVPFADVPLEERNPPEVQDTKL